MATGGLQGILASSGSSLTISTNITPPITVGGAPPSTDSVGGSGEPSGGVLPKINVMRLLQPTVTGTAAGFPVDYHPHGKANPAIGAGIALVLVVLAGVGLVTIVRAAL